MMKKTVLCIFFLIFLTLATCTILSITIEEEMILEVIGYEKRESHNAFSMPKDMYFTDEEGSHLYEVYQGTGWEEGMRAREIQLTGNEFIIDRDYIIVRGASRQPVYGELVNLHSGKDTAPSVYLAVYPKGIPKNNPMLFQAEILEQSEHVLLLYQKEGIQPFTENRAKGGLIQLTASDWSIYSMDALDQMLQNVPTAFLAILILVALAVFGISTCVLVSREVPNKKLILLNCVLIAILLPSLYWVLQRIDFPPSMLPRENIFRVSHYREQFEAMYSALKELSSETTQTYEAMRSVALLKGYGILIIGGAMIGALSLFEFHWVSINTKKMKHT